MILLNPVDFKIVLYNQFCLLKIRDIRSQFLDISVANITFEAEKYMRIKFSRGINLVRRTRPIDLRSNVTSSVPVEIKLDKDSRIPRYA